MISTEEFNGQIQVNVFGGESWERHLFANMTEADIYLYTRGLLHETAPEQNFAK